MATLDGISDGESGGDLDCELGQIPVQETPGAGKKKPSKKQPRKASTVNGDKGGSTRRRWNVAEQIALALVCHCVCVRVWV